MSRRRRSYRGYDGIKVPTSWLVWGGLGAGALLLLAASSDKVEQAASSAATGVEDLIANLRGKSRFIADMWVAIGQALGDIPRQAKLFIIAQAGHEVSWGTQKNFLQTRNAFNITAGTCDADGNNCTVDKTWTGDVLLGPDTQCDANGANCKKIMQRFRVYPALSDSVNDFMAFIRHSRYKDAADRLLAGDISYIDVLHAGSYFTENVDKYRNSIASSADSVASSLKDAGLVS